MSSLPPALRYVDPTVPRGPVYRAWARFSATPPMRWLSKHVGWRVDPVLMRLSGGRLGVSLVIPTALLETRGARSGRVRRNVVIYFHDDDRVVIIASKLGEPDHPAWFHNVRKNPDVTFGGQPYRAEVVKDESERERLWELAESVFPPYAIYRDRAARAGRTIPLVQLTPRSDR